MENVNNQENKGNVNDVTLGQYKLDTLFLSLLSQNSDNRKEQSFLLTNAYFMKRAEWLRRKAAESGEHIPSFILASITDACNLNCKGCYAHANLKDRGRKQLTVEKWRSIFAEAEQIGVSAIMFLGGEPMARREVIEAAADFPHILFMIFTNSTMIGSRYLDLLDEHRNLVPLVSVEGNAAQTDERRGEGVYARIAKAMAAMKERGILFGTAVTVTSENIDTVLDDAFIDDLYSKGCKIIDYVDYVPVTSPELALNNEQRHALDAHVGRAREDRDSMILIAFPGDERRTGGCLAAGRGFFHISTSGDVEPCPFAPYSDTNIGELTLREALASPLFNRLKSTGFLDQPHTGGCLLFEKRLEVEAMLEEMKAESENVSL
jgi:MoaA/NifB/PqqE/SkfB family radical SAM enzyme